jgi:hypothetical protein
MARFVFLRGFVLDVGLFKQIVPLTFHIAFSAGRTRFALPLFRELEFIAKITLFLILHGIGGAAQALVMGGGGRPDPVT